MRDERAYDTDKKAPSVLLREYATLLAPVFDAPASVLEVGVLYGGFALWLDDFLTHPDARITGVDIDLRQLRVPRSDFSPRVLLAEGDQTDAPFLHVLANERGPFDLVIDDASHNAEKTRATFDVLLSHVQPGGYYVIEDWGHEYRPERARELGGMIELVTEITRRATQYGLTDIRLIHDSTWTATTHTSSLAIFRKGKVS